MSQEREKNYSSNTGVHQGKEILLLERGVDLREVNRRKGRVARRQERGDGGQTGPVLF